MKKSRSKAVRAALLAAVLLPATASASDSDSWQYGLSIYGWFPDISGTTAFPLGAGEDFTVPIGDILDNLQFTFQGSFDARKGKWGMFADMIYLDLGKSGQETRDGMIGDAQIPVDVTAKVGFDMKSLITTAAGYYRMVDETNKSFDFVFGLRYADVSQKLNWNLSGNIGDLPVTGPVGSAKVSASYWDAIIGMRGQFGFGQSGKWYIPYYADIGTGDSDLTWQAAGGIGYRFGWGEIAGVWRYLDYDLPSGKSIGDMDFSGPAIGAVFRW
jgi:hypothetical protein